MRAQLTRIGNSRGIRIPKPLIVQCGLGDEVELKITAEGLVIAAHRTPRIGWKQAFASNRISGDELLLKHLPAGKFDHEEWRW